MSTSFDSNNNNNNNNSSNHPSTSTTIATPQKTSATGGKQPQNSSTNTNGKNGNQNSPFVHCHNLLDKVLINCSNDPVGNVHRTWSITLLMIAIYMVITVFQIMHLQTTNRNSKNNNNNSNGDGDAASSLSSPALLLACVWHGMMQLVMIGLMGTFIMKRFPTSFAIGFLFGMIIVFINQNIIYMITFTHYNHNADSGVGNSRLYSAFSMLLAIVLCMFGILLFHFQKYIIVAPIDAKGFSRSSSPMSAATKSSAPTTTYQRYDDGSEA